MRRTAPIGHPTVIATEGSSIQGVSVPKSIPKANLKPMGDVLRQIGLTDDDASVTPPLQNGALAVTPRHVDPSATDVELAADKLPGEVTFLPMSKIRKGKYQPRRVFDQEKLALLANTIEDNGGLNNAIVVRPLPDGNYELIAGERRFLAHELLRKHTIYALVRHLSDEEAAVLSVADNDAREDLTDFERGVSYKQLLDDKIVQNQTELSRRVGRSMPTISRCLAYFKLPAPVIVMLEENPELIGNRVVADLVALSDQGHTETVIAAASKIRDGSSQDSSINWAKSEVRKKVHPHTPAPPKHIAYKERTQLDARIDGRKVILTPPKGVDPEEVLKYLEEMLKDRTS
ncbi:ParB/RepB/Spo0J family partition protein [Pseudomonas sp. MPC6]|uniref:ParB/RepB/Spo0J family partition protein n=1 Tax=unclassified Pseudomonas TaxID=196821 RepID=UPI0011104DB9|nr:ParB/RepB/Spo0J family partition protein [Pseudomonas sp. MPC6]QCY09598.1 ParB/RepB/Spo0J family partition protein [Pseudomonas sp. MPC6]